MLVEVKYNTKCCSGFGKNYPWMNTIESGGNQRLRPVEHILWL